MCNGKINILNIRVLQTSIWEGKWPLRQVQMQLCVPAMENPRYCYRYDLANIFSFEKFKMTLISSSASI